MPHSTTPPAGRSELLAVVAKMARAETRAEAARELAVVLGGEELILFFHDADIGAHLVAPGLRQALPNGAQWRAFVAECARRGEHRGSLSLRGADEHIPAVGYAERADAVFVLVGTSTPAIDVAWLRSLLPLLGAVCRGEARAMVFATTARTAQESALRAASLASTLDRTRHQLEDALTAARTASVQLESVNAQLQDQVVETEMANDQLRSQAAEMEAQATELAEQADELTITNAALSEARAVADKANRAKSEFLATMSHELRTPLNAIGGHVQLLSMGLHGAVTEEQQQALTRIERSARHLLGLINDILNLSRIEAGRVDYDIAAVPLSEALSDIAPMIEPQLGAKSLSYVVERSDELPRVCADREKLEQILLNLLSNAVKFTEPGGQVSVGALRRVDAPGKIFVRVSDTGVGIPADKLESIFEPFTQVDASHSRAGQGTGLGLSISRHLARGMGGDLSVRSELSKGSVFTLTLDEAGQR